MKYKDFLTLVDQTANNLNWRYGQSLMNVLHSVSIELYNQIIDSGYDCYDNDELIPQTLNTLKNNWKN